MPEPTAVVALLLPDEPALLSLVSLVAPAIASGNTVVALVSAQNALAPLTFAEVVATSDIPAGVVNLLSGDRKELPSHFASHMDVNALVDASGDEELSAFSGRVGGQCEALSAMGDPELFCGRGGKPLFHDGDGGNENSVASHRSLEGRKVER